jgi:hypothetical protein
MSRQLRIYTVIFMGLLVLMIMLFSWGILRKIRLDTDSSTLAVAVIQNLFASATATALVEAAHPSLLEQMSAESLDNYIKSIPVSMGPLEAINSITGGSDAALFPLPSRALSASYRIDLLFSSKNAEVAGDNEAEVIGGGAAEATVDMVFEQGQWLITSFRVDSPLLYN